MNYYAGPWDYVKTCSLREELHTDPHPQLRRMIPACRDRLRPSRCEFHAQNTRKELATRGSESVTTCRNHSSQFST